MEFFLAKIPTPVLSIMEEMFKGELFTKLWWWLGFHSQSSKLFYDIVMFQSVHTWNWQK